jgi:hypothetical protein
VTCGWWNCRPSRRANGKVHGRREAENTEPLRVEEFRTVHSFKKCKFYIKYSRSGAGRTLQLQENQRRAFLVALFFVLLCLCVSQR